MHANPQDGTEECVRIYHMTLCAKKSSESECNNCNNDSAQSLTIPDTWKPCSEGDESSTDSLVALNAVSVDELVNPLGPAPAKPLA